MAAVTFRLVIETNHHITGADLRLLRRAREIRQTAVADAWGCSRANVARVEAARRPTREAVGKYLGALREAEAAR